MTARDMTARDMTGGPAPADRSPAEAATVFLHIGTMKTGTSFVQTVLRRNTRLLAEDGVLFPLDGSGWALQVLAARDILDIKGRPTDGAWAAMFDMICAWPGRAAIVSMEFFSHAGTVRVQQVVDALSPLRVVVIITARDLVRVLPSAWQSMIKNGDVWSFDRFVTSVTGSGEGAPDAHRRFWRHHDVVAIASKWVSAVGADNVHLITVPPAGASPAVLWERFGAVVGLRSERYDISQDRNSNFSLSYSDAELMRQVNTALAGELNRMAYKRWATRYFANRVLRADASEHTEHDRPRLGADGYDWAVDRSAQLVKGLKALGVHVVGDLADLMPASIDHPVSAVSAAPASAYPDEAARIIAALLRRLAEVDPHLPGSTDGAELQDPDDAADADDAAEAALAADARAEHRVNESGLRPVPTERAG